MALDYWGSAFTQRPVGSRILHKKRKFGTYQFEGGDAKIVAEVHHQMAVDQHNIVDVDSEHEEEAEEETEVSITGVI